MTRPSIDRRDLSRLARSVAALAVLAIAVSVPALQARSTASDLRALDAYIEAARATWNVPGLAVAIVHDDEIVLAKGYGVRDLEAGGAVDGDTLFAIASNTKAFTAAAMAVLVDEGKLHWDDRVVDRLPYFRLYDSYTTNEMRLRDLLCHRSGLGTFSGDLLWYGTPYSAEEVVRRARFLKPAGPFRAHYGYSNILFIAAGEVIAAVSGQSWSDFVRSRFLEPLGMNRTVTSVVGLKDMDNIATPHGEWQGLATTFAWQPWDSMAAAGGLISSVNDMTRWLRLQLGGGEIDGRRFLSAESLQAMREAHTPMPLSATQRARFPSTHFRAYALGWALMDFEGRKIVHHSGGFDGMFSRVALVPEEGLGLVVLSNSMTGLPSALTYRILDTFLRDEPRDWSATLLESETRNRKRIRIRRERAERERIQGTSPSLDLEGYAGIYASEMYGQVGVDLDSGALVLRFVPNPDLVADLSHLHYDTFVVEWRRPFPWFGKGTIQFILDAKGSVSQIKIDIPNDDFWFDELELFRR